MKEELGVKVEIVHRRFVYDSLMFIINSITEDIALILENVLGSTVNFWLNREVKYREHVAGIEQLKKTDTQSI